MALNNTLSYGATGASVGGAYGAAAGAAIGLTMDIIGSNKAKKAAAAKAAALRKKADLRLAQGQQEADLSIAQGGANQTTAFAEMLGRGVSRNGSIINMSLDEIANRAQFSAAQAMQQARADADVYLSDSNDITTNAKDQQMADYIDAGGSLLGAGAAGYNAQYGKYGSDQRKGK